MNVTFLVLYGIITVTVGFRVTVGLSAGTRLSEVLATLERDFAQAHVVLPCGSNNVDKFPGCVAGIRRFPRGRSITVR